MKLLVVLLAAFLLAIKASIIPQEVLLKSAGETRGMRKFEKFLGSMRHLSMMDGPKTPCKSPQQFEGLFLTLQDKQKLQATGEFSYDGEGKRARYLSSGIIAGKEFYVNVLVLSEKKVMYTVDMNTKKCTKQPYDTPWQPAGVPADAKYLATVSHGGASPGQGLLTDEFYWQKGDDIHSALVTRNGCWVTVGFTISEQTSVINAETMSFNNTVGIKDPSVFKIPPQCPQLGEDEF